MTIEFTVKHVTPLVHNFCKYIIKWIRHDIRSRRDVFKLKQRLDLLPYMAFVDWVGKPRTFTHWEFIELVCSCVSYTIRKGTVLFYIDDHKLLPGSYTPILKVIRYIDYGTEFIPGAMFFTPVWIKYKKSMAKYWLAYKILAQSK